jgi:hypothetical protein
MRPSPWASAWESTCVTTKAFPSYQHNEAMVTALQPHPDILRRRGSVLGAKKPQYALDGAEGAYRLLRLTMDGLLDRTFGERPHASRLVNVPKLDLPGIMRACQS